MDAQRGATALAKKSIDSFTEPPQKLPGKLPGYQWQQQQAGDKSQISVADKGIQWVFMQDDDTVIDEHLFSYLLDDLNMSRIMEISIVQDLTLFLFETTHIILNKLINHRRIHWNCSSESWII